MGESNEMAPTRVEIEIPDSMDPEETDNRLTQPLGQALQTHNVGTIVSVKQGEANTPAEFSRKLVIDLTDYDTGLDVLGEFLTDKAPPGTVMISYFANGKERDFFMLGPEELE